MRALIVAAVLVVVLLLIGLWARVRSRFRCERGILMPECVECGGEGRVIYKDDRTTPNLSTCRVCHGSGQQPSTGLSGVADRSARPTVAGSEADYPEASGSPAESSQPSTEERGVERFDAPPGHIYGDPKTLADLQAKLDRYESAFREIVKVTGTSSEANLIARLALADSEVQEAQSEQKEGE